MSLPTTVGIAAYPKTYEKAAMSAIWREFQWRYPAVIRARRIPYPLAHGRADPWFASCDHGLRRSAGHRDLQGAAPANEGEAHVVVLRRLAKVCLALIFIRGGFDAAQAPGGRPKKVAALGIPEPELAVRANGAVMVAAGSALAFNVAPRLAAAALAASLVPTTLVGHPFWQETEPAPRAGQRTQFLKNLGLLGGLLLVIAGKPGASACGEG